VRITSTRVDTDVPQSTPLPHRDSSENSDLEHLRALSLFHYVLAVMTFLVSGLFVVYLVVGSLAMSELTATERAHLPQGFSTGFNKSGVIMLTIGWCLAALNAISGWCLARKRFRGVSLFTAFCNCLWPPVGTCLGVVTIIVLLRESVVQLYRRQTTVADAKLEHNA
jgi:hypothetical protein